MIIETKANPGDKVWILHNNKAIEVGIRDINISIPNRNTFIAEYLLIVDKMKTETTDRMESKIFLTKEELIKSL